MVLKEKRLGKTFVGRDGFLLLRYTALYQINESTYLDGL